MKLDQYLRTTGFTHEEFARLIGVTQGHVSSWLNEKRVPRPKPSTALAVRIERKTEGKVTVEDLRPDLIWRRTKVGSVTVFWTQVEEH